jgi:hypothetical protein
MEHTKHIWRAVILLLVLLVAGVIGRQFLIPESFGEMGFFRGTALDEFMAKEMEHGVQDSCAECHDDVAEAKAGGAHAPVQCEVCHAPLSTHVRDGDIVGQMAVNRTWHLCADCHQYLVARPAGMTQIDLHEHLELAPGEAIPEDACFDCHDADGIHSP